MTEDEARHEVERIVGREATGRLERFAALVIAESGRQNLIARSTVATIWSRHILDSVQLLPRATASKGIWVDIGTGGGFPGLALAIAGRRDMVLVEPRRRRAEFLEAMVDAFQLVGTRVVQSGVERIDARHSAIISARAVASIADVFEGAIHCSTPTTQWLLPRGAGWQSDVAAAKSGWNGMFHVEHSLSDPAARIVIATNVRRR